MKNGNKCFWAVTGLIGCLVFAQAGFTQEGNMSLTIRSDAFEHEGEIPSKYTCQGEDIAPPLEWTGVPQNAVSLVLIVDDPDAPDPAAPRMTWVHWVVYNIPPETVGFPEGATSANLPVGVQSGINDFKRTDYGGPCPPIGRHRYFHKLYALDRMLEELENPTKKDVETAMEGHILAEAVLMGTYLKSNKGR